MIFLCDSLTNIKEINGGDLGCGGDIGRGADLDRGGGLGCDGDLGRGGGLGCDGGLGRVGGGELVVAAALGVTVALVELVVALVWVRTCWWPWLVVCA